MVSPTQGIASEFRYSHMEEAVVEIVIRSILVAVAAVAALTSHGAFASCQQTRTDTGKRFVCADGTIQLIALQSEHVVIRTYNPDTKSWSEQRFPAIDGLTLDQVSIAIQSSG